MGTWHKEVFRFFYLAIPGSNLSIRTYTRSVHLNKKIHKKAQQLIKGKLVD